jgi:cation diffusion facilitator CzcD-associated flavoprotein CzcO
MTDQNDVLDAVVVGAGFAGLYAIHRLRQDGRSVRVFDNAPEVGGTWYWNRYPGARCDVESLDYSYSFSPDLEQSWTWSERYATGPEILAYLQFVADRLDLRRDITFSTRVTNAVFDEASCTWLVSTDGGETVRTRVVVWATGPLSTMNTPNFEGLESFSGRVLHTGDWPHEPVDFTGRRVAIIGTGSSGIQLIPLVAEQAERLFVLQRTASFSVPARNRALTEEEIADAKQNYATRRDLSRTSASGTPHRYVPYKTFDVDDATREQIFDDRWQEGGAPFAKTFTDQTVNRQANDEAVKFVHRKISEVVTDPAVADLLSPKTYAIGAKRICVDTDYYVTFNRDNVTLVDVTAAPIKRITAAGVELSDGTELAIDDLVFATGFDAMTGTFARIGITGRGGHTLADAWRDGPKNYLGMTVDGFPNMYIVNGPGSPSVTANMVLTSEQQVDWIADVLTYMTDHNVAALEAKPEQVEQWVAYCNKLVSNSLMLEANSWYLGANIPGKPRFFLAYVGGFHKYSAQCNVVAKEGYSTFEQTPAG